MAHVLNATLRLSQRTSTRTVSHVLSGSTRSLSSTSSSAVRGCATRNASFVTAFTNSRSSNLFSGVRAFSTKPEEVEERAESVLGSIKETLEQSVDGQSGENRETRTSRSFVQAPSKTIYVAGLPFFTTEEDLRKLFEGCGNITNIRFGVPKRGGHTPFAFISFETVPEAAAIVQSAKEEPFSLEGRTLTVNWTNQNKPRYLPSKTLYFDNFTGSNLAHLRDFLGELAVTVDNAWFNRDKHHNGSFLPSGLIHCRSVEDATAILEACNQKPGPDGLPVIMRYATEKRHPRMEDSEK